MKQLCLLLLAVIMCAPFCAAAPPDDKTTPSYDMKAQALVDLATVQQKFLQLAKAIPADKLTWRPASDTRSFAEVFLHVSAERYGILQMMGASAPEGTDVKSLEKSTTDRDKIVAELTKSWEFTQTTINSMANADFAKSVPKLGPDANEGDVVYILVTDAHEHLGQAIAYARQNGITPPWTEKAKKKAGMAP
ncbi:MAG TPA: DinB family protein [Candidatus Koribacter sp.]|jgi:uncharacterized damage-inducible protein DinB